MAVSEVSTVRPLPVKYNVQWGYKSNHSSTMNVSDVLATYSKKVRRILQKNQRLARELAASQSKISKLEKANKQQLKIEKLALPRLKIWLENGMQCIHDARNNYARAIELLHNIMTPDRDFTLIDATVSDEPSTRQGRKPPLHPQGRSRGKKCGNFQVVLEENESVIKSRCASLELIPLIPGAVQSSTPVTLMSTEENGKDDIYCSPVSPLEPLASSTEAMEPKLNAAEQVAVNQNSAVEKVSTLIAPAATVKNGCEPNSHNPPPAFSPGYEEVGDFDLAEDSPSSRKNSRVSLRPLKSVGDASGVQDLRSRRRSSLFAAQHSWLRSPIDLSPESFRPKTARSLPGERKTWSAASLLLSTCDLDEAFVETPSSSAVQPSTAISENIAMSHARDDRMLEPNASSKNSTKKSRASTGAEGVGRTPGLSHDVSERKKQAHALRLGNLGNGPPSAGITETQSKVEVNSAASKKSSKISRVSTGSPDIGRTIRHSRDVGEAKERAHASRPGNVSNGLPSAGSTKGQPELGKANAPPLKVQTAKTSGHRSRPYTEPVCVLAAMDDESVPRYASGRPARRSSLTKNYKEPSL